MANKVITLEDERRRLAHIEAELAKATKRRDRCSPGGRRDRLSRQAGCLVFAQLQCESDIRDLEKQELARAKANQSGLHAASS